LDGAGHRGPIGHHDDVGVGRQVPEIGKQLERGIGSRCNIDEQRIERFAPDETHRVGDRRHGLNPIAASAGLASKHACEVTITIDNHDRSWRVGHR
jgi:hypothetical protein